MSRHFICSRRPDASSDANALSFLPSARHLHTRPIVYNPHRHDPAASPLAHPTLMHHLDRGHRRYAPLSSPWTFERRADQPSLPFPLHQSLSLPAPPTTTRPRPLRAWSARKTSADIRSEPGCTPLSAARPVANRPLRRRLRTSCSLLIGLFPSFNAGDSRVKQGCAVAWQ